MYTTGTLLAGAVAGLFALDTLPAAWADNAVLAMGTGGVWGAGILGWARWVLYERAMLAAFGWPGE